MTVTFTMWTEDIIELYLFENDESESLTNAIVVCCEALFRQELVRLNIAEMWFQQDDDTYQIKNNDIVTNEISRLYHLSFLD